MAQIFISYSRVDLAFVEQLYKRLQQMRTRTIIWYDKAPHGLLGGDKWWDSILDAIAASEVFIYVLSNESVQSRYCQAEYQEARRLCKQIITIQAREKTIVTGELADIQYVDMKNGVDDPDGLASLSGALERQFALAKRLRPLTMERTPKPVEDAPSSPVSPAVGAPSLNTAAVSMVQSPRWRNARLLIGLLLVLIALAVVALVATRSNGGSISPTAADLPVGAETLTFDVDQGIGTQDPPTVTPPAAAGVLATGESGLRRRSHPIDVETLHVQSLALKIPSSDA
jgi:hypothetical protein